MHPISRIKIRRAIDILKKSPPERLLRIGEEALIPFFQDAAKRVPAYKKLLNERGVNPARVKDLASFQRFVPIIDKSIFDKYDIAGLCFDGSLRRMKSSMVSSGFSGGSYSFGITGRRAHSRLSFMTDLLLACAFDIFKKKTFLINAVAMGMRISTGLPLAETSVRADMVLALVKRLASQFEEIIIFSNTYFAKRIIEDGIEGGINWRSLPVNFVIGEDWFPENYRDYLAGLLGVDPDKTEGNAVLSSMGICELGVSVFQESRETVRIRRLAKKNKKFRELLFGEGLNVIPMLFHYHPYRTFLEGIDNNLVFTTLSRDTILPLIRYNSKDIGRLYSWNQISDILNNLQYQKYLPEFKLPLVSVAGRSEAFISIGNLCVTPESVKEALYGDFEVASAITGYFKLSGTGGALMVEIQLKDGREPAEGLAKRIYHALGPSVGIDPKVVLYRYGEFPYGVELNYEKKFRYI